jgi:hypothetical protein
MTKLREEWRSGRMVLDWHQSVMEKCPCCGHEKFVRSEYLYNGTAPLRRLERYLEYVKETTGWTGLGNRIMRVDMEFLKPSEYC